MKAIRSSLFGIIIMCTIIPHWAFSHPAKAEKGTISGTKVESKRFVVNAGADLNLLARESKVHISTWSQNAIEVKVTLKVEAYSKEDMEKMFDEMSVSMQGSPEAVSIKSNLEVKSSISLGSKQRIKTKNNGTLSIKHYSYFYEIKMPASNNLILKNSFGEVQLGGHQAKLNLELYECKLQGGAVKATNAYVQMRFSSGNLAVADEVDLKLYESELNMTTAKQVKANVRFSKLNIPSSQEVVLDAYESDATFNEIRVLKAKHNFGHLNVASCRQMDLVSYETKVAVGSCASMSLENCKFTKLKVDKVTNLSAKGTYETKLNIGEVGALRLEGKFCKLNIEALKERLILSGYETDLSVSAVDKDFYRIEIEGKFMQNKLNIPASTEYSLQANLKFGSLKFPKGNMETTNYSTQGSSFIYSGKTKGYAGPSLIKISGYESNGEIELY